MHSDSIKHDTQTKSLAPFAPQALLEMLEQQLSTYMAEDIPLVMLCRSNSDIALDQDKPIADDRPFYQSCCAIHRITNDCLTDHPRKGSLLELFCGAGEWHHSYSNTADLPRVQSLC